MKPTNEEKCGQEYHTSLGTARCGKPARHAGEHISTLVDGRLTIGWERPDGKAWTLPTNRVDDDTLAEMIANGCGDR